MKFLRESKIEAEPVCERGSRELPAVRRNYQEPRLRKEMRLSAITGVAPVLSGIPVA